MTLDWKLLVVNLRIHPWKQYIKKPLQLIYVRPETNVKYKDIYLLICSTRTTTQQRYARTTDLIDIYFEQCVEIYNNKNIYRCRTISKIDEDLKFVKT